MKVDNKQSIRAWLIFSLCSFFYCYQYALQVSTDGLATDLVHTFSVNDHRLGLLSAAFFLTYTLMQIPAGILIDRFGPHRLLTFACMACASGCLVFAIAPHFYITSIARLIMGIGSAFVFIGSLKLMGHWFPKKYFTLYVGLLSTIGLLGAILGEAPFVKLVAHLGWRNSMFILGLLGCVLTIAIWSLIQNHPHTMVSEQTKTFQPTVNLATIFKNQQLWLVALYTGILSISTTVLCSLYGIPLLMAKLSIDEVMAAKMTSLILIGMAIGSAFWGWWSDYLQRRLPPMICAAIFSPLLLALIIYAPITHFAMLGILLVNFGFFSCGSLPAFSIIYEIHSLKQAATALSVINTFDMLGTTLALPLLGRLLVHFKTLAIQNGTPITMMTDYKIAFTFLIGIMIISIGLLFFINETHAKCLA